MKAAIQQRVIAALRRLGDIRETVTYSQVETGAYDPDSGTVSTSVTFVQCPALFTQYTMREIDLAQGKVQVEDRRVLIIPSELILTPRFEDTLTKENGEVWRIVKEGLSKDPSDALYQMQVRKHTDSA